jgi:DNA-binding MarR family transcriptional regulator
MMGRFAGSGSRNGFSHFLPDFLRLPFDKFAKRFIMTMIRHAYQWSKRMKQKIADIVAESFLSVFPGVAKYLSALENQDADDRHPAQLCEVLLSMKEGGDRSISAIGRDLRISKSRMTVLVDRMVAEGLIVRRDNTDDRRVTCLGLSRKGIALAATYHRRLEKDVARRFSGLKAAELERFVKSMEVVRTVMAKTDPQAKR